jgi:hypothetical protein
MTKIKMIAAAVAVASVSTLASAAPPPDAPPVYANGPFSPAVNITNLSSQERQAFALLEGIMQSVEGRIHAAGCTPASLSLSVYSDALTTPSVGTAKLGSGPNSMTLTSAAEAPNANSFRGEAVDVDQAGPGYIANTPVSGYDGTMIYNSANNMMVGYMNAVNVMSINWVPNTFTGYVIKDFYLGQNTGPVGADTHIVYDWGLQSLSKEGYPVEKYWQRSKTRRSDGGQGATAFVKDRLVGVVPCRIAISLSGLNQFGVFQQSGTLTISGLTPGAPVPEIDNIPNI